MRYWRWSLFLIFWAVSAELSLAAQAREVVYAGKPFTVTLEHRQPTVIVFPTAITRVPTGIPETELSASIHERTLVLQPRMKQLKGRMIVETAAGRRYQVELQIASAKRQRNRKKSLPDGEVVVILPARPAVATSPHATVGVTSPTRTRPPARHLVRAILLSMWTATEQPPQSGVTMHKAERVLIEDEIHKVQIVRVYQAPPYYGYTLSLENRQSQPWPLLLPQIEDDGLLVVAAEPIVRPNQPRSPVEVIPPKGRGLLHLIYQGRR